MVRGYKQAIKEKNLKWPTNMQQNGKYNFSVSKFPEKLIKR